LDLKVLIDDIYNFLKELINENIITTELISSIDYNSINEKTDINQKSNMTIVQEYYLENRKPYKVFLEITYKCNLQCAHCYLGEEKYIDRDLLTIEKLKELIDEFEILGVVDLVITGGEIGLHENIIELIQYIKGKNMLVTLLTNGTCFNDNIINEVKNASIHDVKISLYGTETFHDSFVKCKGSFNKSLKTLELLREKIGIGGATCVLSKNSIDEVENLNDLLTEKGIPLTITPLIFPTLYGDTAPLKLRLNKEELYVAVKKFDLNIGGSVCTAGVSRFRISPNGEVNPCEMLRHINLGNLKECTFKEILKTSQRNEWINTYNIIQKTRCIDCSKKKYCINCIGMAYLETGNLMNKTQFACELASIQVSIYE
jgi:radical SAM protein with 4Fe4S-binding SPASM domain